MAAPRSARAKCRRVRMHARTEAAQGGSEAARQVGLVGVKAARECGSNGLLVVERWRGRGPRRR
jgi:hypothetical protein